MERLLRIPIWPRGEEEASGCMVRDLMAQGVLLAVVVAESGVPPERQQPVVQEVQPLAATVDDLAVVVAEEMIL